MSKKARKFELELNHTGDGTQQTAVRTTETGRIMALSVANIGGTLKKGMAYARVYSRLGGASAEHVQGSFINDYVYNSHFAHWTGDFPVAESSQMVLDVWSSTAARFRVSGVIDVSEEY